MVKMIVVDTWQKFKLSYLRTFYSRVAVYGVYLFMLLKSQQRFKSIFVFKRDFANQKGSSAESV